MKNNIKYLSLGLITILLVLFVYKSNYRNAKEDKSVENLGEEISIKNLHYLQSFIKDNSTGDTVCVDDFNNLYYATFFYCLNDFNLIFVDFYSKGSLLYIRQDSIFIYSTDFNEENLSFDFGVEQLLLKHKFNEAKKLVERKSIPFYRYFLEDNHYYYAGVKDRKQILIVFRDIIRTWVSSFKYEKTIKNKYIKLGKIHFIHKDPLNIESLRTVSIPKTLP